MPYCGYERAEKYGKKGNVRQKQGRHHRGRLLRNRRETALRLVQQGDSVFNISRTSAAPPVRTVTADASEEGQLTRAVEAVCAETGRARPSGVLRGLFLPCARCPRQERRLQISVRSQLFRRGGGAQGVRALPGKAARQGGARRVDGGRTSHPLRRVLFGLQSGARHARAGRRTWSGVRAACA